MLISEVKSVFFWQQASDLVGAKARADEAEGQKAALDDHIRTLKVH